MQLKSFTAWCNLHLAKAGMKAEDLTKDFGDGIMLLRLVEVISEDNLGKYNRKPVCAAKTLPASQHVTLPRTPCRSARSRKWKTSTSRSSDRAPTRPARSHARRHTTRSGQVHQFVPA